MKVTNCSMGCMYATGPLSKCFCICKGITHGLMTPHSTPRVECSPAARERCQGGFEDGDCQCACRGVNHGLYREIDDFHLIPIVGIKI